jgi:ribose transport system permease protein
MNASTYMKQQKIKSSADTKNVVQIALIAIILMIIAAILSKGVFLQPRNLMNLLFQNGILILIALAQLLIIIVSGIDLSVGAIMAMSSVLIVLNQDLGSGMAILIALGASMIFGAVSGSLVTFKRLPSFVVTLAMMQIVYSLAQVLSGGAAVYSGFEGTPISASFTNYYLGSVMGIPNVILTCMVVIFLVSRFLRTSYGHFAYAIGGNEKTAYFSGIPVERVKVTVYILAALLAGLAAVIFVGRVGMGDPRAGQWLPLDSIAAVSIGGASLSGGVGSVAGTVIGVLILGTLTNIMNLMGVPPTIQPAVKGIVIIIAVYLNSRKKN